MASLRASTVHFSGKFRSQVAARPGPVITPVSRRPVVCRADFLGIGKKLTEFKAGVALKDAGEYDAPAVNAKMMKYINDEKVVVFSWTGCPYCKNAKQLLTDLGANYTAVELDLMGQEGKAMRAELYKLTDRTSVPNVFIGGKTYGGLTEGPGLNTLNAKGELVPMLKSVGAM
eukprot:gene13548-19418_t